MNGYFSITSWPKNISINLFNYLCMFIVINAHIKKTDKYKSTGLPRHSNVAHALRAIEIPLNHKYFTTLNSRIRVATSTCIAATRRRDKSYTNAARAGRSRAQRTAAWNVSYVVRKWLCNIIKYFSACRTDTLGETWTLNFCIKLDSMVIHNVVCQPSARPPARMEANASSRTCAAVRPDLRVATASRTATSAPSASRATSTVTIRPARTTARAGPALCSTPIGRAAAGAPQPLRTLSERRAAVVCDARMPSRPGIWRTMCSRITAVDWIEWIG